LAARPRELGGLHHVRLQLLQTADLARLENLRDIRSVHCCAVRRDVRLSADAVRAVRLASDQVSQSGLLSHNSGHLWSTLLGESGDPHFSPLHIASYIFIGGGFWLLSSAWTVLYHAQRHAQRRERPARIRHPQYVAFVAILLGFLLQWPTLLTLLMFPSSS
jgi:hypothetical protein